MELNILEEEKNRVVVELKNEGHGFANALRKSLWSVKATSLAGYNVKHPLTSHPAVIIETDGTKAPKEVLSDAAKKLGKECDDFLKEFKKKVK